jgi:hypothetical protein
MKYDIVQPLLKDNEKKYIIEIISIIYFTVFNLPNILW